MIKVENLCKSFGSTKVHNGINLEIKKGAITYIIGPSGTGKSVLLKQLMGLIKPDSGKIYVDGFDITTANKKQLLKVRYKFGMLFQNAALFDSFTIFDNVAFPLREHRKLSDDELQEIVTEKLKLVGLSGVNHKYPSELSGGMRKRVGLARAIALSPDIMMYDEPTTGLDPIMTDIVDDLIYNTQKELNITSVVFKCQAHIFLNGCFQRPIIKSLVKRCLNECRNESWYFCYNRFFYGSSNCCSFW